MRILFVLENYYPNIGGVETLFRSLVESLVAAGHHCTVITSRLSNADPLLEEQQCLTIVRIPVASRYFFTFQALIPVFKRISSCDLVQTTSYNAALPAFIGAMFFRKKVVVTFHEAWGKLWFRLPFMGRLAKIGHFLFEQMLLRLPFDRFVAVSKSTAKRLREEGVSQHRIRTIYNGIDYLEFSDRLEEIKEKGRFTFTYFGRLGISKGLDLLLKAAGKAKLELPDTHLLLIIPTSPVPFLKKIKSLIKQLALEDYIDIQHDLPFPVLKQTILASDCVVIPSYSEGFCFAAVETVALGRPIISSHQASLPEVVSGRYVAMDDLNEKELWKAMKKAYNQEWEEQPSRKFELKDTVAGYLELYQELFH